jgi:hypothetical protein
MLLKHARFLCFLLLFQLFEDLRLNVLIFLDLASTGKPVAVICNINCGVFALTIQGHTGKPVAVPIVLTCVNVFELSSVYRIMRVPCISRSFVFISCTYAYASLKLPDSLVAVAK